MNKEEIKAKYQPRQLENQAQFEDIMHRMNQEQGELNRPYIDRKLEIAKQRELLKIQKQAINQQLSALSIESQGIDQELKPINRLFHDIKHEFCILNPRERFIRPKDDEQTDADS
jgi:predicted ATP-binding protein involved in virulence